MRKLSRTTVLLSVAGSFWLAATGVAQRFLYLSDLSSGILMGIGIGMLILALLNTRRNQKLHS